MDIKKRYEKQKKWLVKRWEGKIDKKIIKAFLKIPREDFVLEEWKSQAYDDTPLPILADQTISQPTTVMQMLQHLELKKGMKVLEIGAGSGYNAALISELVGKEGKVITVEILPELVKFAKDNLKKAGIKNVRVVKADGSRGYAKEKPYDRIVCTAASPKIPEAWKKQLKKDGIILAPVGDEYGQTMLKVKRIGDVLEFEELGDYLFVPLLGKHGFNKRTKG
ncbi:protein-L-isoaspartate O-methyltransferase [Candidatus Woesearchaeota archaeon]|nr:MAG: protein-L-isoaspartate O-methyltransferase [Candidatus Woesearchaeota archaeon]